MLKVVGISSRGDPGKRSSTDQEGEPVSSLPLDLLSDER
jgi:hypothetical protein